LTGVKMVELAGIGPGPFAAMLLSDMGAEIVRVERAQVVGDGPVNYPVAGRGRRSIGIDLKVPDGVECLLRLLDQADALIEGFRPGVTERLGVGPDVCLARNPRLVYGRMTGWGQDGPMALVAGHDINYIALAGCLAHFGRAGGLPTPPLNMVGDYGGGGMLLAFGVVCGILEARASGQGQVVDAAMVDGAALLMAQIWGMRAVGEWNEQLGSNRLDTGAPYYDVYETSDAKFVSIGSIEPQFYAELLARTGLADEDLPAQTDQRTWPVLKARLTELFRTKTRAEWCEILEGSDACFAPVLPMSEALGHPHIVARGTFVEHDGVSQPAPAPRFSRTPGEIQRGTAAYGEHTDEILADWGFATDEIAKLHELHAVAQA
jgi:alpha-methylacyl-CoA racemase